MAEGSPKPCTVPEEIKKYIRAVLLSKIGGVSLENFCRDYRKLAGKPLIYSDFGFSSLKDCLKSIPDAVRFAFSEEAGIWMLYGIGDPNSFMSSAAKKAQFPRPYDGVKENKNKKKGNKNKQNQGNGHKNSGGKEKTKSDNSQEIGDGRRDGESCGADEELRVPKNKKGLYTVCVKYSGSMYEHEVRDTIEEITELFAEQGDVIETSISRKLSFFRFHKEDEAIAVIKKYNGRFLRNGTVINVLPAKEKLEETASRSQGGKPKMADRQNNRMGDGQNSNRLEDRTREKDRGGAVIFQNGLESSPMQSKLVDILVSNLDKATTWRELKKHFSMFEPVRANVYHSKAQDGNECTQGSVSFSCIANASCAMESMKGSYLRDRKLRIELKRSSQGGDEVRETLGREERPVNNGIPTANPSPQKKNGGWKKGKGKNGQSKSNLSKDHEGSNANKSSSDAESIDSIAPELVGSGGSRLKFNVNERNVAPSESLESWDAETSGSTRLRDRIAGAETSVPRPCTPQGIPLGRGRGRGLSGVVHHEGVMKKPHRPSLADLASRLEEL